VSAIQKLCISQSLFSDCFASSHSWRQLRIFITTSFIEPQRAWYHSVPMAIFGSNGGVLVFGSAAVRFQALLGMIMFVVRSMLVP
jgi:hypothetical protein